MWRFKLITRMRCATTAQGDLLASFRVTGRFSIRKKLHGARSEVMRKICLPPALGLAFLLGHVAACANIQAQTTRTATPKTQHPPALSCKKDAECPSGQRCGFVSGCKSKGKCVVPSHDAHCIDPGGRCGCSGRAVDIFCAVGSPTEYTSAPTNAIGPCPKP
jgi:hypothetical protein